MKIFRFKITTYDSFEEKNIENKGFVAGETMGEAVDSLNAVHTAPSGENELIDLYIYEIDSFNKGILFDDMIEDVYKDEK